MKSNSKSKKKTLYGRYDDYDLTDPGEDGFDRLSGDWDGPADDAGDAAPARKQKENHAMRLADLEGSGSPSAFSARGGAALRRDTLRRTADGEGKKPAPGLPEAGGEKEKPSSPRTAGQAAGDKAAPRRPSAGYARTSRPHGPEKPPAEPMVSDFAVTRIRADADGALLTVTLEGNAADGVRLRRDISVTAEQYASLSLRQGPLTAEQADALTAAGELCLAIRKGMELLGYGDLSVRRMAWKLTSRGVTRETAGEAAAYLQAHGLIREDDAALRRAAQDARKLWGPRRIMQDLRAQGYTAEAASAALDALTGADLDPDEPLPPDCVDFEVSCAALIRKKYGGVPEDRDERRKMTAALIRLGYDPDTIRDAAEDVLREE